MSLFKHTSSHSSMSSPAAAAVSDIPLRLQWHTALPSLAAYKKHYIGLQVERLRKKVANWLDDQCRRIDAIVDDLELFDDHIDRFEHYVPEARSRFRHELTALGYTVVYEDKQMTVKAVTF